MKKYLEYKDDKSSKFWQIEIAGNTHTVTYGKIGTDGTEKTKEFSNEDAAQKDAEKLIDSKKKKGYVNVDLSGLAKVYLDYGGFEISDCIIMGEKNYISFIAQEWNEENDDPLEVVPTAVFFHYPDDPPGEQWAVRYLGETTGCSGTVVSKPLLQWIYVTEDGEVYCVGQGDDDWEKPIADKPSYFSNVKCVRGGHAIALGPGRKIYLRTEKNSWKPLDNGLTNEGEDTGFRDIDGFSESDMYACGGKSDLWHYNGDSWSQIKLPVNDFHLEKICFTNDQVYILTNTGNIIAGRGTNWQIIKQEKTDEILENIVTFNNKALVSTESEIYEITSGGLEIFPTPEMESKAYIASSEGILLVAGPFEAKMFDGKEWKTVL